jgi:ABC-type Na+ efflux pump permease subunit
MRDNMLSLSSNACIALGWIYCVGDFGIVKKWHVIKKRRNPTWSIFRSLLSFLWSSKQKGWYFLSYHHNVFIPMGFLTSSSLTESLSCSKAIESSSTTNFLCLSIIYFLFCIRPQRRPHFEICTCWSLLPFTSYEYNTRYYDLPCTSQFRIIL